MALSKTTKKHKQNATVSVTKVKSSIIGLSMYTDQEIEQFKRAIAARRRRMQNL
jgi:hypothetical protein